MIKNTFVLFFSAGISFLANLLASILLASKDYGYYVSATSTAIICGVVFTFGLPAFFLANRNLYFCNAKKAFLVIVMIELFLFLILCPIISNDYSFFYGYYIFFIINTVVAFLVLKYQISQKGLMISCAQSVPSFMRGSGAIFLLVAYFCVSDQRDFFYYKVFLFGFSLFGLFFLSSLIFIHRQYLSKIVFLNWIKEVKNTFYIVFHYWRAIMYYWLSSSLSVAYSLAIAPLAAFYWGGEAAAYIGIYMLFWSVSNIFITAGINNRIVPLYSRAIADKDFVKQKKVFLSSIYIAIVISVLMFSSLLIISKFAYIIWPHMYDIENFCLLISIPIALRALNAAIGMISSFEGLINKKVIIQIVNLILLFIVLNFINLSSLTNNLSFVIASIEIFLFIGYLAIGFGKISCFFIIKCHKNE